MAFILGKKEPFVFQNIIIFSFFLLLLLPALDVFAQEDDKIITFHTQLGKLTIELFTDDAPRTTENFLKLAESGFYDRTLFHRVIEDFMIQGGDPLTKPDAYDNVLQWGTGDAGYTISAEFNDIKHNRGIVSMARSADPNSASSQFFVVHKNSNSLDGQYTVFGRLVTEESFETLDKIAALETTENDIPLEAGLTEIKNTEILSRSQIPDLLILDDPARMISYTQTEFGEEYSNQVLGISFIGPTGWAIQEPPKTSSIVPDVITVGPTIGGFSPVISVTISPSNGKSLDEHIIEVKNSFQSSIDTDNLEILSERKISFKEQDAYEMIAIGNFQPQSEIIKIRFQEVIILGSDKFYTLTYTNSDTNFENNLDRFKNFMDSFTILGAEQGSSNENSGPNSSQEGGGCLIATATFGSELAPQVQQLRELRDNTILSTKIGSEFMSGFNQFYYTFSPNIADLQRENPVFKEAVKITITPLLTTLSILNFVDIDSEEKMLGYGIGIILLNIGLYFVGPVLIFQKLGKKIIHF